MTIGNGNNLCKKSQLEQWKSDLEQHSRRKFAYNMVTESK